jgi:hypothetical protein
MSLTIHLLIFLLVNFFRSMELSKAVNLLFNVSMNKTCYLYMQNKELYIIICQKKNHLPF